MPSNTFTRSALLAALALTAGASLLMAQTDPKPAAKPEAKPEAKPAATQPARPPLTPEQQKIMDTIKAIKPDVAYPKIDPNPFTKTNEPNPNFGKIQPGFQATHESFLKRKEKPIGVLFLGDSITAGWGGHGKAVWAERYAKLDAANFGIGGDRTEHVLWRIENGELDGISPKVVVLMIGTNNSSSSTSKDIAAGVTAIVKKINEKLPNSKLLLLGVFPRGAAAVDDKGKPSGIRTKLTEVNTEIAKLDDGKKTFYLDISKSFLEADGNLSKEVMPDALHPNTKGYQIWADAMQAKLDELLK